MIDQADVILASVKKQTEDPDILKNDDQVEMELHNLDLDGKTKHPYMCRRYSGQEAVEMGLANKCVPADQLDAEVKAWAEEICQRSPTAIAIAKRSFNMDTAHQAGIAGMGMYALKLYYDTEESREGVNALKEKRQPEFRKYAK